MKRCLLFLIPLFLLFSCTDDDPNNSDPFYKNIKTDVSTEEIQDRWALTMVTYMGNSVFVEADYEECGLTFFDLLDNGLYEEYIFVSNNCNFQKNSFNWSLENGVLSVYDNNGNSDQFAITAINDNNFKANYRIDADGDGSMEVVQVTFIRYDSPSQGDFYNINFDRSHDNRKIELVWDTYDGYNSFSKYQILRKADCQESEAEIVAEITDVNSTTFFDENPPVSDVVCYQLKVFTNDSEDITTPTVYIHTDNIVPDQIQDLSGYAENDRIYLNWQSYTGFYFSHYEVRRDFNSNYSTFYEVLTVIQDFNTTSCELDAAYYREQYYSVLAVDIFGNKSSLYNNRFMIDYTRSEMIPDASTHAYVFDVDEPYFYYIGSEGLSKYNYQTNTLENRIVYDYNSSLKDIRINESENGKELVIHETQKFIFRDAQTLALNFLYNPEEVFGMNSYELTEDDLVITDHDDVYKYYREDNDFYFMNERSHFPDHQGMFSYMVKRINNKYVVGHRNESQGLQYNVDNLELQEGEYIDMPIQDREYRDILYSESYNFLLSAETGKIYDTTNFNLLDQLPDDVRATSLSLSSDKIYCTKNVNDRYNEVDDEKSVVIYQYPSMTSTTISTSGYPRYVFENNEGTVYALMAGYNGGLSDLFIEQIIF